MTSPVDLADQRAMQILVFGKSGQVGQGLANDLAGLGDIKVLGRADVDLTDSSALKSAIDKHRPDILINAAAYTAVDRAESEPNIAQVVNVDAPRVMADACHDLGALMIHYSTDYVFDGQADHPYVETDAVAPQGVYGRTKLDGERAVQDSGAKHLILRTSWVYSNHGRNFLKTMLRLAQERNELRVVDDQIGTPTYAGVLSRATAALVKLAGRADGLSAAQFGLYHVTCTGHTSWCGFAQAILQDAGINDVKVNPISTAEYPTPARRPAYSVLDTAKFTRTFDIALPAWRDALRECLREGGHLSQ